MLISGVSGSTGLGHVSSKSDTGVQVMRLIGIVVVSATQGLLFPYFLPLYPLVVFAESGQSQLMARHIHTRICSARVLEATFQSFLPRARELS